MMDNVTVQFPQLPAAVSGERHSLDGRLGYYVDGPAPTKPKEAHSPPLLLIHSVNAAASAYEVKPLYEFYRRSRPVYALDLPGFGSSDRSKAAYTPRLMTDAIHAMVLEIRRAHGDSPIDAIALSLSCEFLARAAVEAGKMFRSIALISPTGFDRNAPYFGPPGSTRANLVVYRVVTFRLWRRSLFFLLVSRPSIRFFLRKTWGSAEIDEGLARYDYLTAHQEGAWWAPYYFVSGFLFSGDISRIYQSLQMPVFMAYGVRGDFTDYRAKSSVQIKRNWTVEEFQTGALPHFETLDVFTQRYDAFLGSAEPDASERR